MTTYTITSYGDSTNNTQWSYFISGGSGTLSSGDTIELGNDLGSSGTPLTAFVYITIPSGVIFDGKGYKVYINIATFGGLFQLTSTGGTIQNIGIICGSSVAVTRCGLIVRGNASMSGTIINCHTDGNALTTFDNGGIVGYVKSGSGTININNCAYYGNVASYGSGGIVARVDAGTINITDCYFTGNLTSGTRSGGIISHLRNSAIANITRCYATGTVNSTNYGMMLGLQHGTLTSATITNCYATQSRLFSNVTSNYHAIGCVAPSIVNSGTLATNTNNSTTLADIQGQLYEPVGDSSGNWSTNNWTAGSGSDYPILNVFSTGTWENYAIYSDSATLVGGVGIIAGDPHVTTLLGQKYDYNTLGYSRYFDNCSSDNRLVINCEIRKKVIYNRWRSKRYIRRCSIITPKSYIEIKTGFRGEKVSIIKSNIDPSEDITIEENGLTFNDNAMRHCTKCTFDTAENDNALNHEIDNKYHKILQWERNAIIIKIKLDQEYIIDFENVNADNLQPGKIGLNFKNKSQVNSYKGIIVDQKWASSCTLENIECNKDIRMVNNLIK